MSAFTILLRLAIGVALGAYFLRQVRKPSRGFGQRVALLMNRKHAGLTDWGLTHVRVEPRFTMLDVGCGGGRTVQRLAAMAPEGRVYGIDYAAGSVAASRRTNAESIAGGRVEILQASVSALPFPDGRLDLVTAVETQYYWPDLVGDMREIRRVLKPGGTLAVIVESYKGSKRDWIEGPAMRFLLRAARLSPAEQEHLFATSGYEEVQVFVSEKKGWLCAVGRNPMPPSASKV